MAELDSGVGSTIKVGVRQAKARFSALIKRVEAGEDVIITRRGRPVVCLTPVKSSPMIARRPDGFPAWMGSMRDEISIAPDFDDPEADAALVDLFYQGTDRA